MHHTSNYFIIIVKFSNLEKILEGRNIAIAKLSPSRIDRRLINIFITIWIVLVKWGKASKPAANKKINMAPRISSQNFDSEFIFVRGVKIVQKFLPLRDISLDQKLDVNMKRLGPTLRSHTAC